MLFRRKNKADSLDAPLLQWSPDDCFTKRDLLRSICVQGASGSGKTNFVGYQIAKALAGDRDIGCLCLASKPVEDVQFWQGILRGAGRSKDLLVFGPGRGLRFNVLEREHLAPVQGSQRITAPRLFLWHQMRLPDKSGHWGRLIVRISAGPAIRRGMPWPSS
jgi:hypothetical protein